MMNHRKTTIKTAGYFIWVMAAWVCFLGMGGFGGGEDSAVITPHPAENHGVMLVDQSDVSVMLTHFSFNGATFVTGRMGKGDISIDFKTIDRIFFLAEGDDIVARVRLKKSDVIELRIKRGLPFWGVAPFGNFRIKAEDIKTISFGG